MRSKVLHQRGRYQIRPYTTILLAASLLLTACDDTQPNNLPAEIPGEGPGLHCLITNPFSQEPECKQYVGVDWTEARAVEDCAIGQYNRPGSLHRGMCNLGSTLGTCTIGNIDQDAFVLHLGGTNADFCSTTARACVTFFEGVFASSPLCEDQYTPTAPIGGEAFIFEWPTLTCMPPLEGEPPGQGPDGEVCTWNLISGCTEEGRSYYDYGACETVRTNRPYYPLPGKAIAGDDDPRLQDDHYLAESAWVKSQVEACACICCHTEQAPMGPSKWATDAGPLWTDTMSDTAISLFAGYVDSSALGAFNPDDNNGFNRIESALPTTDVNRMLAFFEAEFQRRNIDENFARSIRPIGGPLVEQLAHQPEACPEGVGITNDGVIEWGADKSARYVYVLDAAADNPGIPPNLDTPEGTLWRVDVPFDGDPMPRGSVRYGQVPSGSSQRVPDNGAPPPALIAGETYYLYALEDIALPIARCLFTQP